MGLSGYCITLSIYPSISTHLCLDVLLVGKRAIDLSRSSIGLHSFQGIRVSPPKCVNV